MNNKVYKPNSFSMQMCSVFLTSVLCHFLEPAALIGATSDTQGLKPFLMKTATSPVQAGDLFWKTAVPCLRIGRLKAPASSNQCCAGLAGIMWNEA